MPITRDAFGRLCFKTESGASPSRVLVASMPKSGTYLTGEFMRQLGLVATNIHLGDRSMTDYRGQSREQCRRSPNEIEMPLAVSTDLVLPGQFIVGHLSPGCASADCLRDFVIVAVTREARAAIVSFVRWIHASGRAEQEDSVWTEAPEGPLRTEAFLEARGERLLRWFSNTSGWRVAARDPKIVTVSFEVLMGDLGAARQRGAAWGLARAVGADVDANEAFAALRRALKSKTMTSSGARSRLDRDWSPACEALFVAFGGVELNAKNNAIWPR